MNRRDPHGVVSETMLEVAEAEASRLRRLHKDVLDEVGILRDEAEQQATEIDALRAENKVLRKGIEDVMDRYTDYDDSSEDCCRTMYDIAGLALSAIAGTQGTNDG